MDRRRALELLEDKVKNINLRKHMLAAEAVMRSLATHLGEDVDLWGLTGLLHDIDYDETASDPSQHGVLGAKMLKELGVDERIVYAVESHVGRVERRSRLDRALYATDPLTGLIVAAALMHPSKKLKGLDTQFVLNRFREKRFAAGANRDQIRTCSELGLSLKSFMGISLKAMQEIDGELGL